MQAWAVAYGRRKEPRKRRKKGQKSYLCFSTLESLSHLPLGRIHLMWCDMLNRLKGFSEAKQVAKKNAYELGSRMFLGFGALLEISWSEWCIILRRGRLGFPVWERNEKPPYGRNDINSHHKHPHNLSLFCLEFTGSDFLSPLQAC